MQGKGTEGEEGAAAGAAPEAGSAKGGAGSSASMHTASFANTIDTTPECPGRCRHHGRSTHPTGVIVSVPVAPNVHDTYWIGAVVAPAVGSTNLCTATCSLSGEEGAGACRSHPKAIVSFTTPESCTVTGAAALSSLSEAVV